MPVIEISQRQLLSRGNQVRAILSPISKDSGGPAWQTRAVRRSYIIGTHDGSPPSSDYRDWRFTTFLQGFRAMYYEEWLEGTSNVFSLHRAYMSIFRIQEDRSESEFFCLHCDPNEAIDAPHAIYKRGPHFHAVVAGFPVGHAHIALNRGHLSEVLTSVDTITMALEHAVMMLKEEILDPFGVLDVSIGVSN